MPRVKKERDPLDRYYTPDLLALAYIRWLVAWSGEEPTRVLEPCAGEGPFGSMARATFGPRIELRGCEIDPHVTTQFPTDLVPMAQWQPGKCEGITWIVTNPPFLNVYETVPLMRRLQEQTGASILALVLRLTTLEKLVGYDDPPHAHVVSPQCADWGGPGGDLYTSGDSAGPVFFVWRQGPLTQPTQSFSLPKWRPGRERKKS